MPRPTKAFRRQKTNAAAAWKRGEKKEAYKLWEEASASLKAHTDKKKNKRKLAAEAAAVETAAAEAKAAEAAAAEASKAAEAKAAEKAKAAEASTAAE